MPGVDDGRANEDAAERVSHEGDPLRHLGHGVREHLVDQPLRHRFQAGEGVALQIHTGFFSERKARLRESRLLASPCPGGRSSRNPFFHFQCNILHIHTHTVYQRKDLNQKFNMRFSGLLKDNMPW